MPWDFLSKIVPPNSITRGWVLNARRAQLRFDLEPCVRAVHRLNFFFRPARRSLGGGGSEFAGADRVNELGGLPASIVDPTEFAFPKMLGNALARRGLLSFARLNAFPCFIRERGHDVTIALTISGTEPTDLRIAVEVAAAIQEKLPIKREH